MIRRLVLICVLLAGALAGLATQTRMSHLRALVPDRLPGWTGAVAPEARLLSGAMHPAALPGTTLRWRAIRPGANGLRWRLTLDGPGIALEAVASLAPLSRQLSLSDPGGQVDLADSALASSGARGTIRVLGGAARMAGLPRTDRAEGTLGLRIDDAALGAVPLGAGPASLTLDPLGSWTLTLSLTGGAATVSATASGRRGADRFGLRAEIAETAPLPPDWTRALDRAGRRDGTVWTVEQTLPLALLWQLAGRP